MAGRKDALLAAAYLIANLKAISVDYGLDLHTSLGRLEVYPNSPNTVPAEAVLFIERRAASPVILAETEARMLNGIDKTAAQTGVSHEVRFIDCRAASSFSVGLLRMAVETSLELWDPGRPLDTIGGRMPSPCRQSVPRSSWQSAAVAASSIIRPSFRH